MLTPNFVDIPATRSASAADGKIIQDLEERMPRSHPYRSNDRITWAHETTHGLQANIRNANVGPGRAKNAFYCLEGRAILCLEPKFRMSDYADLVPQSVRGQVYKQYMVDQRRWWNDCPLYPWDEWTAYTNGTAARLDLGMSDGGSEVQFMLEMLTYSAYVLIYNQSDTSEENKQREAAFSWMSNRSFRYLEARQENVDNARDYWASVIANTPEVVGLLERLDVLYPRVVGAVAGTSSPERLVDRLVCSQIDRDAYRGVPHGYALD